MSADEEIRELAEALDPPAFFKRIDLWRKGDVSGAQYEPRVSGTRSPKTLAFDVTDAQLNAAQAEYREHLQGCAVAMAAGDEREARSLLRKARRLEERWLKPIITPDKEMLKELERVVSDAQSCNECGQTKEAWVRQMKKLGVKTPIWRRKKGMCGACYQDDYRKRGEVEAAEAS